MISHLTGTVAAAGPTWLVIDLAGVGLRLTCPPATVAGARPGTIVTLQTSLVVREDSLTLHGFEHAADRDAFEMVQTASKVGPKLAMAMMSVMDAKELVRAITEQDSAALCRVPGIGRKGAERIILDLSDRISGLGVAPSEPAPSGSSEAWSEQVLAGLMTLGWSQKDSERAVETVSALKEADPGLTTGDLMRLALRSLAPRSGAA